MKPTQHLYYALLVACIDIYIDSSVLRAAVQLLIHGSYMAAQALQPNTP